VSERIILLMAAGKAIGRRFGRTEAEVRRQARRQREAAGGGAGGTALSAAIGHDGDRHAGCLRDLDEREPLPQPCQQRQRLFERHALRRQPSPRRLEHGGGQSAGSRNGFAGDFIVRDRSRVGDCVKRGSRTDLHAIDAQEPVEQCAANRRLFRSVQRCVGVAPGAEHAARRAQSETSAGVGVRG